MKVIFVGIHNKPDCKPLDSKTRSGKLIDRVIADLRRRDPNLGRCCLKTNYFDRVSLPTHCHYKKWRSLFYQRTNSEHAIIYVFLGALLKDIQPHSSCLSDGYIYAKHPAAVWSNASQEVYINDIVEGIQAAWAKILDDDLPF